MNTCPKCGGKQGYQFFLTVEYTMTACGWNEEPQADSGGRSAISLYECLDCGAKMRESTVKKEKS